MKKIKINGKEVELKDWDDFWNHVRNKEERVELEEKKDDMEVYIYTSMDYVHGGFNSNWFRVMFTHKRASTENIISRVRYHIDEFKVLSIQRMPSAREVFLRYNFPDYDDELEVEIAFLTYRKTKDLEKLMRPVYKIVREIEEYFKSW